MNGRLLRRSELTDSDQRAMYALLETYFEGVGPEQFRHDLDRKNWVILVTDEAGVIRGFTTILVYDTTYKGEPVNIAYSGDTIVDRSARRIPASGTGIDLVGRRRRPRREALRAPRGRRRQSRYVKRSTASGGDRARAASECRQAEPVCSQEDAGSSAGCGIHEPPPA